MMIMVVRTVNAQVRTANDAGNESREVEILAKPDKSSPSNLVKILTSRKRMHRSRSELLEIKTKL